MELEFQELELRYERLRVIRPAREKRLLASLAESGQQVPILVVHRIPPGGYVVIDGFKRVRSLKRLSRDTVRAATLDLEEAEALLVSRLIRTDEGDSALEQAWLLEELSNRFGMSQHTLARRFDRSVSWVSRRLALVSELPDAVQEGVRRGKIVAHGAAKYLVPLARANKATCEHIASAIASARLSSREIGLLYKAWRDGTAKTRERLRAEPLVLLKALKELERASESRERSPGERLLGDLELVGQVARRVDRQFRDGVARRLLPEEVEEVRLAFKQSWAELVRLERRIAKEMTDAGPRPEGSDPGAARQGCGGPGDCAGDEAVEGGGEGRVAVGLGGCPATQPH